MDKLPWIFCTFLLSVCLWGKATGNIFGRGKETIFSYSADVRTGTTTPAGYASQFGIFSTLSVVSNHDGTSALFQFKNISIQIYNGPLSTDEDPEATFSPASQKSFEVPFEVSYNGGLVKSILADENKETTMSMNMKKAIVSILQLDMAKLHFDKSYSFPSEEKTLYGTCPVEYSVSIQDEEEVLVRKMPSLKGCKGAQKFKYWTNLIEIPCSSEMTKTYQVGSSRVFEIQPSGSEFLIKKVSAQGMISIIPYPDKGYSQYIQIKQTFELESQKTSAKYHSNPERRPSEPTFTEEIDEYEYLNLPHGGSEEIQRKLKSLLQKQLDQLIDLSENIRIGGSGDQSGFLEQKQKEKKHSILYDVMITMRYLDYQSLKSFYSTIDLGTSSREETKRTLFLELLSQTGTKASIHLIVDLVVGRSVKKNSAIQILKTLPFYIRHPDIELLQMYEEVLGIQYDDRVKQAATLSFATMVNRICKHGSCSPEVLDKYIVMYLELFKESTEYKWKLNYLEGLSNIKIGNVVKYLEPIIKGDQPYPHHIRFLAMWATHLTAIHDPDRVFEVYWPILENKSEHLELRVGAFTILLLSKPQPDRFYSLASLMDEEPEGSHLYYLFYSSMESLAGTTHPCYQGLKKPAQHILQYARKPEKLPFWTGNHMFDYSENYYKYGSFMQAFMVADQKTSWPSVLYFLQQEHFLGSTRPMISLYVKMQGVKKAIHDVLFAFGRDGEKVTHLQKLLSKYKIEEIVEQDEPLHVELILQYQDQAVMTYYYNETNIMELVGVIQKTGMGENDFHINYQRLMFPMMNDFTTPTDLGLPMSFKTQTPFFFSLRGNFTAEIMDQKTTRENQIDIKYWRQSEHFFSIYNPFSNLWQGISRTHTVLVHIPLNFYLSADLATRNFKFSLSGNHLTIPGIGVHAGSVVYAKPSLSYGKDEEHTLSLSCPSCSSYTPIKGEQYREKLESENIEIGELNMNYVFRYFDCDVYDIPFMLEDATDYFEMNMNDRFSDGNFLLTVFQLYDAMMRLPFYGRCGFVAKITPGIESAVNNLSGNIQLTTDDFKNKAKVILAEPHKERYMIKGSITQESDNGDATPLYDFSLNYQNSIDLLHYYLRFKFSSVDPSEESVAKLCLDGALHYPEPPVDPLKQREPKYEAVNGFIHTVIGLAGQNTKCPKDGVVFKVDFRATPVPDISKECYRSCAEDAESPEWTHSTTLMPYTPACLEAAIDSTELRRIEVKSEASQFLADIVDKSLYALYIDRGSDPWGDYVVGTNVTENDYPIIKDDRGYVFQLVPSNGFLIVDTVEDEDVDRKILDYGVSSDFNSRFEDYMIVADEEDFFASCVLTPHLTLTLDGTQISDKLSSCYSLAVGHCRSTNPHFAIMVRNIEEINSMALKIYSFKNYLEIIPSSNNSVEMIVNGEHVNFDSENGYEFVSGPSSFRVWQRTHKKEKNAPFYAQIISQPVEISVDYGVDRVIVKLSAIYSGDLCGLCGDYNRPQNHHKWSTCEK